MKYYDADPVISNTYIAPEVLKIPSNEIIKRVKKGTLVCSFCGKKLGTDMWIKIESDGVSSTVSCFECKRLVNEK